MKTRKKILVVEDDQVLLETMRFKLEKEGYEVEKAIDAGEALRVMGQHKVDLIISDIMMPNISGLSLLNMLNEFYRDKTPVIIVSSLNKADIINSAIGLGAYDFIVKPINFNELTQKINHLLNNNNAPKSIKISKP